MTKKITEDECLLRLKKHINGEYETQRQAVKAFDTSESTLSQVLSNKSDTRPTQPMLDALGLEKHTEMTVFYTEIEANK